MGKQQDSSRLAVAASPLFGHAKELHPRILALIAACLALISVSMSFADFSSLHVSYDLEYTLAFVFFSIIPLSAAATLFGAVGGASAGLLLGISMSIHANVAAANYFEYYFITPSIIIVTSVVSGALFGFLCSQVARLPRIGAWNRVAQILVASLAAGIVTRALFVGMNLTFNFEVIGINPWDYLALSLPNTVALALLDTVIFAIPSIFVDRVYSHLSNPETRGIQEVFRTWLALGALTVFVLVAACESLWLTTRSIEAAQSAISGTIQHIQSQVEKNDSDPDILVDGLGLKDYGTVIILKDGVVVGSNDPDTPIGTTANTLMDYDEGSVNEGIDQLDFIAEFSADGLATSEQRSSSGVSTVVYMRCVKSGNYHFLVCWPEDKVFETRRTSVLWTAVTSSIQLVTVFAIASILLKNIVTKRINKTNETLALITEGNLDERIQQRDTREFTSLSDGINTTVSALEDAIAEEAMRNAQDLATARAIQESALPSNFPPFPNIDRFDIFASMNAAKEVGGDFYDFFLVDDHRLGFLIADVSGKGIPASLFMMAAKTELQNLMGQGKDLAQAIRTANEHLCAGNDAGMFVTVWAAVLDFDTGELTYVNAGHNPPLLRSDGQWQWLKKRGGLFLGTFETAKYRSETLWLKEGDQLLLYTDGVNEAFSIEDEEYGDERLMAFVSDHANQTPCELVRALRSDIAAWATGAEQSDDITMLCLEYGTAPRPVE